MAKIAKRRGRWVTDAYIHGRRVVKAYRTKREAEAALADISRERQQAKRPAVDPFVTVADYAPRFLADCRERQAAPATLQRYEATLRNHIVPRFGTTRIRDIRRSDIKTFMLETREAGSMQGQKGNTRTPRGTMSHASAKQVRAVLSALLALAVEDELILANPAKGAAKRRTKAEKQADKVGASGKVKALKREDRNLLLSTAQEREPEAFPAFMLMALAGLRVAEAVGLRWGNVDLTRRNAHVCEQVWDDSTKTGAVRDVDLSEPLTRMLGNMFSVAREQALAAGAELESRHVVFPWLSANPTRKEAQTALKRIRRAMERTVKAAGLPRHYTPHSLRHTFCSLLIAAGVSPVYVQQQAGHASVEMTVSVYGSWFPVEAPGAVDQLAEGAPIGEAERPKQPTRGATRQPVTETSLTGNSDDPIALSA